MQKNCISRKKLVNTPIHTKSAEKCQKKKKESFFSNFETRASNGENLKKIFLVKYKHDLVKENYQKFATLDRFTSTLDIFFRENSVSSLYFKKYLRNLLQNRFFQYMIGYADSKSFMLIRDRLR